jgi:protein-disulfide isomerase
MMSNQPARRIVELVANGAVILAALAVAAVLVRREFFQPPAAAAVSGRLTASRIDEGDWSDLIALQPPSAQRKVQLVVFNDLECPFCRRFHNVLAAVKQQVPNDLNVIFVHLPLDSHRFAVPAARATECARQGDRFDEMVDALFSGQDSLGLKSWVSFARDAGVTDTAAFSRCVAIATPLATIENGIQFAERIGITGTPTVLVDGWRLSVSPSERVLTDIVTRLKSGESLQRILEAKE